MSQAAENLYRRIGRLIEVAPPAPTNSTLSPDLMRWLGQVAAAMQEVGDLKLNAQISTCIGMLNVPNRADYYQKILLALYQALAITELRAPQSAQGAFIPVGNAFDAFSALSKILGTASADVMMVDPYLDDTVITDFAGSLPENILLRLLADEATAKPNLEPAARRWNQQHPTRPINVRFAPQRTLHDRAIFIDKNQAWIVTQSLKDLAKRSPAEIVRGDDTAALKIAAYENIWSSAALIV